MNESAMKSGGTKMTVFGIISIILGMCALLAPGFTGLSIATILGVIILIGGIVRIFWAFAAETLGKGIWRFAIGGLTLLCGIALVLHPMLASGVLTILLAVYFILDGGFEIFAGIARWGFGGGWLLFGGIVSLLLGFMIWAQFPLSGAWAIGVLLGIKLFFVGLIMLMGGSAMRSAARI